MKMHWSYLAWRHRVMRSADPAESAARNDRYPLLALIADRQSDDRNTHRETVPELARPAGERLAPCRRSAVRHRSGVNAESQRSERWRRDL